MEQYVLDATIYKEDGIFCFVPIENMGTPQQTLILGMNILSSIEGFDLGDIVGVVHLDGDEAVDNWLKKHPEVVSKIKARLATSTGGKE